MEQLFDVNKVNKFREKYGYGFKDPALLREALTHTSYANEYYQSTGKHIPNNERLEFLGDTVMGTIISICIFKDFSEFPEGKLSKIRSTIVCEASLTECFLNNGMSEFLMLGKGEELTGGRVRPSVLSDCFEAIIGAVYLDGGFDAASEYVNRVMAETIKNGIRTYELSDAKTYLQEAARKLGAFTPKYKIVNEEGPDHNKKFTAGVTLIPDEEDPGSDNILNLYGEGTGQTKKEAEQNAACNLINKMKDL